MKLYRDAAKILGGALGRNLLRGLFKLALIASFAPQAMGVVRSVYALFKMIASFAELGLDAAMVRFVSHAAGRDDPLRRERILATVLVTKIAVAATLGVTGLLVADVVADKVLSDRSLAGFVRLAFAAVAGQLLWDFVSGYLAAHRRFDRLAAFLVTVPALMLVGLATLFVLDRMTIANVVFLHLVPPAIAALLWWPTVGLAWFSWGRVSGAVGAELARFSRWLYLSKLASAGRTHLNPVLLKNASLSGSIRAGEESAGLYAVGGDLAAEVTVLSQSLATVMLPEVSRKTTPREIRHTVLRAYRHLAWLLPAAALAALAAEPALQLAGRVHPHFLRYLDALPIFYVLYLSSLFTVAAIPIQSALYALDRPQAETGLQVVTSVVLVLGSIALIPRFGGVGAAAMVLVQRLLVFCGLMVVGLRALAAENVAK